MRIHHTKTKGDLATAMAHADMAAQGFMVFFPVTEHAPFDLAAYRDGHFIRVQVKYRTAKSGRIEVHLKTSWADRNGSHYAKMDKGEVDLLCIYCPDTGHCYYIDPSTVSESVCLRLTPPQNNQALGVRMADEFRTVP